MKLTMEADLTPQELREFLGLPDVRQAQERWLAQIEERILKEAANVSPEKIIQSWIGGASSNIEIMTKLFESFSGATRK